jgi:hypothetical protein
MERPSRRARARKKPKLRRRFQPNFIGFCVIAIGLFAVAIAAFFVITGGSSYVGRQTYVVRSRSEDPVGFWGDVAFMLLLGGFFIREGIRGCLKPAGMR